MTTEAGPVVFGPLFAHREISAHGLVGPWLLGIPFMVAGLVVASFVRPDPKEISRRYPADRSDETRRMREQPPGAPGDQYEREKRYLRKDGGVVWARVVRAVVRDHAGSVRYHASVLMDVTGSMRQVPVILQANLPRLMGLLIRKGYLEHPQILIGAIGDATCDTAPLQLGQFESGIEIEEDLGKLFL